MLAGATESQVRLATTLLESAPLGRRYVLDVAGHIVGMGSLATRTEPRPAIRARAVLGAPRVMGAVHGLRSIVGAARGLLTIADPPDEDEAQIHRAAGYAETALRRGWPRDRLAYPSVLMRRPLEVATP
jgi:hypothetical protein